MSPGSDAPVLSITQQDGAEDAQEDGEEDEDELPPAASRSSSDAEKTFFRWGCRPPGLRW